MSAARFGLASTEQKQQLVVRVGHRTLSASIDDDPEKRDAINFITAIPKFARYAATIALLPRAHCRSPSSARKFRE
ncbi:MAG TPA: hypothetical protein VGO88_09100 [Mycetocola sp.]|nr:hypothetical protein [Mycetocola sp.]